MTNWKKYEAEKKLVVDQKLSSYDYEQVIKKTAARIERRHENETRNQKFKRISKD